MHVLMLTSTLPRWPGDQQADFVGEMARAWLAARADARITILAPHSPSSERTESQGRLTINRFRYMRPESWQALAYPAILPNLKRRPWLVAQVPTFLAAQYAAASRIIETERIDCVYAHWVMPQGPVALALKRRLGVPYILQTHSSDLAVFEKFGGAGRRLARQLLSEAAHFFCVNSNQLELARSILPSLGTDGQAPLATVLPMGVGESRPYSGEALHYDIGTIGRLSRKKGFDLLIKAAESLAVAGLRPRICIAGDGEEALTLKPMVDAADIAFPGFITGAAKDEFLASCARFVFPAKAHGGDVEGLPVALLEALMRGQPVLASRDTNIESLPEWETIKPHVVFVPDPARIDALAEGLAELMARPPGSAAAASDVLARYRWENLIEEYLEPIECALGAQHFDC